MRTLPRTNLKLLIVDDDPNTRTLLAEALEGRGARVRVSASAREAQETLVAWHPDLMISDVGMPLETGYELIRRVRVLPAEQGGRMPAIACTSFARPEDLARAMHAGFDAVVAKPVDIERLVETIAHVAGVRGPDSDPAASAAGCPGTPCPGPRTPAPDS